MIKYLVHIWLVTLALAGLLVGCSHAPSYDSRLLAADSLMNDHRNLSKNREDALSQLVAIQPESLNNGADRAYHALLLTQARYLNYNLFTDDSLINVAVKHYSHQSDLEKLTRSYIYKGAVMEDLDKLDSAMTYYKMADVVAAEDDYFNRGYVNLRMGKLYTNHHAYDGRDIEKLEQALSCFEKSNDSQYIILCKKELGALYRMRKADLAEKYLTEAISLAEAEKDTLNIIRCSNDLAYLYFMQRDKDRKAIIKAYRQLQRIKALRIKGLEDKVYTTFACIYANIGKPDSAMWFLQRAGNEQAVDSVYQNSNVYLEALSHVEKARGDMLKYLIISHKSDSITFSSLNDPDIVNIMYSELSFDQEHKRALDKERKRRTYIMSSIFGLIILSLLLLALFLYRRSHRYDDLIIELKDQSQSQINDLMGLQGNISEMKINDERLKSFIASHMSMMREMIDACYHEPNNRIAENMKRIVKFQDSNRDNWVKLYDYIDIEHNNIMTRTRENYPQLNDRDLLLLALTCMGFSYIQTAIIMGYSNATSVSVIKQRLAKKMGLECSLNEYIESYDKQQN